jgi:hypothetical protein
LDKKRAEILSYIYDNRNTSYGIRTSENEWKMNGSDLIDIFSTKLSFVGSQLTNNFDIKIDRVTSSYIDSKINEEVHFELNKDIFTISETNGEKYLT